MKFLNLFLFIFFTSLSTITVAQMITAETIRDDSTKALINDLIQNVDMIDGLEILIAEPKRNTIVSAWGHAALRFVSINYNYDFVIDYTPEENITLEKTLGGISGKYKIIPSITKYKAWDINYTVHEHRAITSVFIPSTPDQRKTILTQTLNILNNKSNYQYYFWSQNCFSFLYELFKKSDIQFIPDIKQTPISAIESLLNIGLAPFPPKQISKASNITEFLQINNNNDSPNVAATSLTRDLYRIGINPNITSEAINPNIKKNLRSIWQPDGLHKFCNKSNTRVSILKRRISFAIQHKLPLAEESMRNTIAIINNLCL